MAIRFEEQGGKFIVTDPVSKAGREAERKIWEAVKAAFRNRNCIAYWGFPILTGSEIREEADIFIADKELGFIFIDVESANITQITEVEDRLRQSQDFCITYGHPYQQTEDRLYAILEYRDRESEIRRKVGVRSLVALPSTRV